MNELELIMQSIWRTSRYVDLSIPRSAIKPSRFLLLLLYDTSRSRRKFLRQIKEKKEKNAVSLLLEPSAIYIRMYIHMQICWLCMRIVIIFYDTLGALISEIEWHPRVRERGRDAIWLASLWRLNHSPTARHRVIWGAALCMCMKERERERASSRRSEIERSHWGLRRVCNKNIRAVIQYGQGHASYR